MIKIPDEFLPIIIHYSALFSKPVFTHAKLLLTGAILTSGKRTVTSALSVMGLIGEKKFHKYHRVLSMDKWSPLVGSRILFSQLLKCFHPTVPMVLGIDETLERRWGAKISKRGIYRDAVRSSKAHFVKSSGLRWVSLMLLVPVPWANRIWSLPFMTVLAPSERYAQKEGKAHKKITDWAREMLVTVKRWCANRDIIVVADGTYAVMEFLDAVSNHVTFITRLRLDAALYGPVAAPEKVKPGPRPKKGDRLPSLQEVLKDPATPWQTVTLSAWYGHGQKVMEMTSSTALWYHSGKPLIPLRWVLLRDPEGKLEPTAFLSTDTQLEAEKIVIYFVRRWAVEVTFELSRECLGVETQRQWSDKAIERTTPVLFALFSIVTLMANRLQENGKLSVRACGWYKKPLPTFSDALAAVRKELWQQNNFTMSSDQHDMVKLPRQYIIHLQQTLAYAA